MKRFILLAATCLPMVGAETNITTAPTLTIMDRTYTNVTVRKINATTVMLRFDGGIGSAAITNLPEPYKSQFHNQSEVQRFAESEKQRKDAKLDREQKAREAAIEKAKQDRIQKERKTFTVRVDRVLSDGFIGTALNVRNIYWEPPQRLNQMQRIGASVRSPPPAPVVVRVEKEDLNKVFIKNGPKDASEGKEIQITGWVIGPKKIEGSTVEEWDCASPRR